MNLTDKITHRVHEFADSANPKLSGFEKLVLLVNQHGLLGLYKLILGQTEAISKVLKIITEHLQADPNHKVLVHCMQGKDRTGIISMLIASIAGASDEEIVQDYALSNGVVTIDHLTSNLQSKALSLQSTFLQHFDDSHLAEAAPREAMREVLRYLRSSYGSVSNYLCSIGFDSAWQTRLRSSLSLGWGFCPSRL